MWLFEGNNLYKNKKLAKALVWLQLAVSALLAASIIIGYFTYRASVGQLIEALAANIASVSKVVETTAESVQMNQGLIESTRQTITLVRGHINDLNATASNLARQAPQYVEYFRTASEKVVRLGDSLSSVGEGLMFSVPTSVQMEGLRPVVVMSRPLEAYAQRLKAAAQEIREFGTGIPSVAVEGSRQVAAVGATTSQALSQLDDSEKLLGRLQETDLPSALKEMSSTSEKLRTISQQIAIAGNMGVLFLVFGLLLSAWCFLNSLNMLYLIEDRSI